MLSRLTKPILPMLLLLSVLLLTACAGSADGTEPAASDDTEAMDDEAMEEMEEGEHEHEEGEHEHEDAAEKVPNDGAVITIISPADGASIPFGQDIEVEVEVTDFALGEEGNHWHVYVDGTSFGMVVGGDLDNVVRGLDPGTYELSVVMANGDHIELEEGDKITITVEE